MTTYEPSSLIEHLFAAHCAALLFEPAASDRTVKFSAWGILCTAEVGEDEPLRFDFARLANEDDNMLALRAACCLARAIAQNADDDLDMYSADHVEAPSAHSAWELALGDARKAIALTVSGYLLTGKASRASVSPFSIAVRHSVCKGSKYRAQLLGRLSAIELDSNGQLWEKFC